MPMKSRETPAWSAASSYVAHCSSSGFAGPASVLRSPGRTGNSYTPPGKNGSPVNAVSTSAAARLNVLCPETYPAKAGVTNVGS